jgi:hypothetical protein
MLWLRILMRMSTGDAWKVVDSRSYLGETELQEILTQDPTLTLRRWSHLSRLSRGSGSAFVRRPAE